MLNTKAIEDLLDRFGLSGSTYRFSGEDRVGDGLLTHQSVDGDWVIYSLERGHITGLGRYPEEPSACRAYLHYLREEYRHREGGVLRHIGTRLADGSMLDNAGLLRAIDSLLAKESSSV